MGLAELTWLSFSHRFCVLFVSFSEFEILSVLVRQACSSIVFQPCGQSVYLHKYCGGWVSRTVLSYLLPSPKAYSFLLVLCVELHLLLQMFQGYNLKLLWYEVWFWYEVTVCGCSVNCMLSELYLGSCFWGICLLQKPNLWGKFCFCGRHTLRLSSIKHHLRTRQENDAANLRLLM